MACTLFTWEELTEEQSLHSTLETQSFLTPGLSPEILIESLALEGDPRCGEF